MTDSNIVKSLLDNKEEEKTDLNIVDNLNQQPSNFTNVFKTESKFDDYVNNTLFDEETFDFASQDFDFTNNIFTDLTEEKPQQNLSGLAKGLGIEIGTGIGADLAFAPLLALGPLGIAAYGGGQFTVGYYANIAAQKARGVKKISQAEAVAAGLVQIIPAGTTAKGLKGVAKSGAFGAGFGVGETFLRDLLGDDVTRDEYLLSLGFGGAFGAGFKGSLEGLSGIFNKIKGKTPAEADAILTKQDNKTINDAVKNIDTVSKKQKQKLKEEGVDTDKLDQEISSQKQQTTNINEDSIPLGSRVKAADRGNIGTVVGFDESTGKFTVSFKSKKGAFQSVKFDPSQLTVTKKGKVLQSDIDFGEQKTSSSNRGYTRSYFYSTRSLQKN